MASEAEPDSNWKAENSQETEAASVKNAETDKNDEKEEGEISDDDGNQEIEPVSSSTPIEEKNVPENPGDSEAEEEVTSTNGTVGSSGKLKEPMKNPIKAYTLVETVEKLKKTISFVMLQKKRRESGGAASGDDSPDKNTAGDETAELGRKTPDSVEQDKDEDDDEEDEDDDDADEEEDEMKESDDDIEDEDQDDSIETNSQEQFNIPCVTNKSIAKDTEDDDSLRTPDPSSLSKSVMNLVDSVISDNLAKKKSTTEVQSKTIASPISQVKAVPAPIKIPVTVSTVGSSVVSTPKEIDDQSTILSYNQHLKIFRCDARTCGIKTDKEEVVKAHIEQHRGTKNVWYRCIYCKTITKSIDNIKKHLQKFHVTDVLRFSKLNSPSVQDVYLSLIGETKKEASTPAAEVKGESDMNCAEIEKNPSQVAKPLPVRRSSTGSNIKPAPVVRRNSSDSVKPNYTTKLECYYKDQYYRCKMCGFKSQNADTFSSHAYYHLHGSDGRKGLANCSATNRPHDVADCTVVKGMISLLQRQKESDIMAQKNKVDMHSRTKIAMPTTATTPDGKRIIFIPTSQTTTSSIAQIKQVSSPIVIEPRSQDSSNTTTSTPVNPIVIEPEDTTINDNGAATSTATEQRVQPSQVAQEETPMAAVIGSDKYSAQGNEKVNKSSGKEQQIVDASPSTAVPIQPIELDSDFSGEDEYEDDLGEEGLRFGIFERNDPDLSRFMPYARGENKSLMEEVGDESPKSSEDDQSSDYLYNCVFLRCSQWCSNSAESFTIHNLTKHARTPVLPCSYCSGSFRDEHQLINHIDSSHKLGDSKLSRLYQCAVEQCYFATNYINEFKSHNTFEHCGCLEFKCIYCQAKFPSGDNLIQHLQENIMKLIQCPLCPLASQMKSVILTHISQEHPDHPKRIITLSYTTCHKKSQSGKDLVGKELDSSCALNEQETKVTKAKPGPTVVGGIGGSMNCNFVCGTCSFTTNVQDDFHEHILSCVKTKRSSPKPALIAPAASVSKEAGNIQPAVVQESGPSPSLNKDHSRKSKLESRAREGSEVEFQEEKNGTENSHHEADCVDLTDDIPEQVNDSAVEQAVKTPGKLRLELTKPTVFPPEAGPEKKCKSCAYTTVYGDLLPTHEASHNRVQNKKRNFICFLCGFSADKMKVYKYHLWLHKSSQADRFYSCYYCKTHSNQQHILEKHIEETHKTLAFKYEVVKEPVTKLECLYCSKIAYSSTEKEMVKHVEQTHGLQRLHRFMYDVYGVGGDENSAEIMSPDQEGVAVNGGREAESQDEAPSRRVRLVRAKQNTIADILNGGQTESDVAPRKGSLTGMEARFQCPYCAFTADEMYAWKKHMQKYVSFGAQEFQVFRCVKCKWTSSEQQRVLEHAYGKHSLGPELTEDDIAVAGTVEIQGTGQSSAAPSNNVIGGSIERYHCDMCEFGSNQYSVLEKHMTEAHNGEKRDITDGMEEIAEAGDEIGFDDDPSDDYAPGGRRGSGERHDVGSGTLKTKFFRCETCPYVTPDKRLFYKHKKSHERQSKIQNGFQCGHCHFKASKAYIVKVHSNKYHQTKPLKVLSISEGRPVKVFYDNDVFGEDIDGDEEPDQAFPIQPVKGKAPLNVIKDLTENSYQAVPALPSALNKIVVTPTKGARIPDDMIFKLPQKCPHCDFATKVRYNLVRHLKSHQDEEAAESGKESGHAQATGNSENTDSIHDLDADAHSDSSTDDDEAAEGPAAKRARVSEDLTVYGYKIPDKDLFQCNKCVFMDKVASKVRKHFCARHAEYCPFKCGHCTYVTVSAQKVSKHCQKAHPSLSVRIINRQQQVNKLEGNDSKIQTKPAPVKYTQQKADGSIRGPDSSDEFDEKLQSYVEAHPTDPCMYKCKLCGDGQEAIPPLKRHILSVHLVFYPYKCKYCFFAAVELNKTIKHVERSHPGQPLLVKKRKFTGQWPTLSDGTYPFETDKSGPSAPKHLKEPLQVKVTPEPSKTLTPSPKMPILSRAPNIQSTTGQTKPKMLVSLLTQSKVPVTSIAAKSPQQTVVVKTEPVDTYWDNNQTSANWSWHSPQSTTPRSQSRETTPQKPTDGPVDDASSQTTTSSGADEGDKSEKKKLLYNCLYCGYQSKWAVKDVKIHLCAVHMRKYPYKCKHCPYTNRMKNNIFKHIRQEHPGMGLDYEDLIKEIDGMICVKEDVNSGMVYIGAYNEEGEIWELDKANAYRKDIVGGWKVADFQKLTEIQMNRTQSMGKPKSASNKQRVELVVPRPFTNYSPGKNGQSLLSPPGGVKVVGGSPNGEVEEQATDKHFHDGTREQIICHRCKVCDYKHTHLMKVYLHYLGVHLRKKPYVCGHCGFSQYTRHIVEKHHKTEHSHLEENIRYLIPELKEQMKPYIVKVISRNRAASFGASPGVNNNQSRLSLGGRAVVTPPNRAGSVSMFSEPVSSSNNSSARPSPDKSFGTSGSSETGTPPNTIGSNSGRKIGKGLGKLESAIQRLAQNAMNNASSASPSPVFMEPKEEKEDEQEMDESTVEVTENPPEITESSLEIAVNVPTPDGHKCDLCVFVGKTAKILKHHRRTHFTYRPYGCKYCALKSFYIASIRSHCELKHPGKPTAYLQFEKPNVLQLDPNDRRLNKSSAAHNNSATSGNGDNEDDSLPGLSSSMLPPLSKEDLALAEQGGFFDTASEDTSDSSSAPAGPVICPLCPHFLPNSMELRKHLGNSHPGYGPYKCGYCSAIQRFKKTIRTHMSSRHPTLPPKYTLVDPSVPQSPGKGKQLDSTPKDGEDSEANTDTPFMTDGAEEMSLDTSDMIEYVEDVSNGENGDDELKRNLADASSLYSCKHCNFVTKQGGAIRHHVMAHLSYCPYKCGHCGRQSVKSYPIKLHIQRQHPGKPMRVINNRNEEYEKTLVNHYVKHAVKNQSLTDVKSSVEVSSLGTWRGKRKQFENSAQKSPAADSSSDKEKSFSDGLTSPNEDTFGDGSFEEQMVSDSVKSQELLQYEKTLGNRKVYYQCALCGFKCDNNTSIRRHLMWETTYKPYCCSLCKRSDILAAALRKHLRDKHPHSGGRVIFKKNTQKEQRLIALVNQSRHYTEKYKPPRIITPVSPPRAADTGSDEEDEMVEDQESLTPEVQGDQLETRPITPKKLANGMVKCPSCPKIMKLKLFRKHMVFHGGHRVKCDICDKTFYYPSDVLKHHGTAHRSVETPYQWSKLASPVKPQNSRTVVHNPGSSPASPGSSGLLKVKIAFKKDAQPEIVQTSPPQQQDINRMATGGNRHPNLITTEVMAYVQETDPKNPVPPHSKQASSTPMIDGLMLSPELFKKKGSGKLHCPHCTYATTNREHLKIHYIRHVPPRWKCKYCETKGQLSYELRKHVKARHPDKPQCMIKLELDYSLARENQGEGPLGPDFKPRLVQKEEDTEDVEEEDLDELDEEDGDLGDEAVKKEGSKKSVNLNSLHFNCFHCSFTAKSMKEFAQHVRSHEQSSPVKSPGSSKAPASPIHTDDDETEQFVTVTPVYGTKVSIEKTEEIAEEIAAPEFECKLCPFTSDSLDAFEVHQRIHLPYRCGYCSYSQYQKGKIKQHHNYKHAPQGLELNIIEQNPQPPKQPKAQPAAKQPPAPEPKSVAPISDVGPTNSKPGPKSSKPGYTGPKPGPKCSKPGPKCSKKFISEVDEGPFLELPQESDDGDVIVTEINANDDDYQPEIKLLNVKQLPDELLSVLLMKYGATETPWMQHSDVIMDADSADAQAYTGSSGEEEEVEEMELDLGEVSDNREEVMLASDVEEEGENEGDIEEGDVQLGENLLDDGEEEIRVEDDDMNEGY